MSRSNNAVSTRLIVEVSLLCVTNSLKPGLRPDANGFLMAQNCVTQQQETLDQAAALLDAFQQEATTK